LRGSALRGFGLNGDRSFCEHVLEDVQRRLEENPQAMRVRREKVEHPFETIKARMGRPTA
jgi:hypothetical protein